MFMGEACEHGTERLALESSPRRGRAHRATPVPVRGIDCYKVFMTHTEDCNAAHDVEFQFCPDCHKPIAVLRGMDADCRPITMMTHQVDPKVVVWGVETWVESRPDDATERTEKPRVCGAFLTPRSGLEPLTLRLTAGCSAN